MDKKETKSEGCLCDQDVNNPFMHPWGTSKMPNQDELVLLRIQSLYSFN